MRSQNEIEWDSPVDIDTIDAVGVDHFDDVGDKGRSGRGRGNRSGEEVGASPSTNGDEDLGVVGVGEGDELVKESTRVVLSEPDVEVCRGNCEGCESLSVRVRGRSRWRTYRSR